MFHILQFNVFGLFYHIQVQNAWCKNIYHKIIDLAVAQNKVLIRTTCNLMIIETDYIFKHTKNFPIAITYVMYALRALENGAEQDYYKVQAFCLLR